MYLVTEKTGLVHIMPSMAIRIGLNTITRISPFGHSHNLSVQGGSQKINYYIGMGICLSGGLSGSC